MLGKLRQLRRELGAREGLLYAVDQGLARLSRGHFRLIRYAIVAQPVVAAPASALRADGKTRIERIPAGHALVTRFPRPPHILARRYRDGACCLAATSGETFVGFLWWQPGGYDEDEVWCRYRLLDAQHCVWDFDVHVEPRFRLGRALARLWAAANTELAAQGIAWTFSRIALSNRASLAAHARLGAVECARATFLRLGRLQLAWLPGVPWLRISWADIGRPVLALRAPAKQA